MVGILTELANSGYSCYVGSVFTEAFSYGDDLKLLTPSVYSLHQIVCICENYANNYNITFNAKKGQFIIYKAYNVRPADPFVKINGAPGECFRNTIHLGYIITENGKMSLKLMY